MLPSSDFAAAGNGISRIYWYRTERYLRGITFAYEPLGARRGYLSWWEHRGDSGYSSKHNRQSKGLPCPRVNGPVVSDPHSAWVVYARPKSVATSFQ